MVVVADGEHRGRNLAYEVTEHSAHVPLRLGNLAPGDVVEREAVTRHLARRAVLALPEGGVRRVLRTERLQLLHVGIALLRRVLIAVVDETPEQPDVLAECLVAVLVQFRVGAADRQPRNARVRDVLADNPGGSDVERRDGVGLVAAHGVRVVLERFVPADVRLVPHQPVAHPAGEMARQRVDPAIPRRKALFAVRETRGQVVSAAALVDGIAVIGLKDRVHPMSQREIHRLVKPREVVFSLLLLALGPSPLQADGTDSKLRQVILVGRELREVPVEDLAADHPLVVHGVGTGSRDKRAHAPKLRRVLARRDVKRRHMKTSDKGRYRENHILVHKIHNLFDEDCRADRLVIGQVADERETVERTGIW